MLTKDRRPATTQVTDWRRPTGMPSMDARSRRSPAACTATPMSLRVNQAHTAARQATETITATRSLASKTMGAMCQERCQGNVATAVPMGVWPQSRGMRRLSTTRTWASPMVATVRMRRGERRKRRMTTNSAMAVRRTDATRPVASPTK